jgi:outer membrane protein OmpA-like peptidoglycan-associated protein
MIRIAPTARRSDATNPAANARPAQGLALVALLACALGALPAPAHAASDPDPDAFRLAAALSALESDPALAERASLERYKARQALAALQATRSRDRAHALFLAEAWVQAARDAAQAEALLAQGAELDRERDQIMLDASRREAADAQREADRLRQQQLVREEEAARQAEAGELAMAQATADTVAASAQASQAMKLADARAKEAELARKEADLAAAVANVGLDDASALPPSRRVGNRTVYTLPGTAFASGSTRLGAGAQGSLKRLASTLRGKSGIRIEAHTDSQGADAANLALSQQRAEAVRAALAGAGIQAASMRAVGKGETAPVADNADAAGRARNRRVEISAP